MEGPVGHVRRRLQENLASAYLTGQSFAFEASVALLAGAAVNSMVCGKLPVRAPAPAEASAPAAVNGVDGI